MGISISERNQLKVQTQTWFPSFLARRCLCFGNCQYDHVFTAITATLCTAECAQPGSMRQTKLSRLWADKHVKIAAFDTQSLSNNLIPHQSRFSEHLLSRHLNVCAHRIELDKLDCNLCDYVTSGKRAINLCASYLAHFSALAKRRCHLLRTLFACHRSHASRKGRRDSVRIFNLPACNGWIVAFRLQQALDFHFHSHFHGTLIDSVRW